MGAEIAKKGIPTMRKSAIGKLGILAGFAAASLAARSANPIFTDTFMADPAPIVVGDTCYVITTQDENDGTPARRLIRADACRHWQVTHPIMVGAHAIAASSSNVRGARAPS